MKLAVLFVLVVVGCAYAAADGDLPNNEIEVKGNIVRCATAALSDLVRCFATPGKTCKECLMDAAASFIKCLMKNDSAVTEASAGSPADADLSVIGVNQGAVMLDFDDLESDSLELDAVTELYEDIDDPAVTDFDMGSGKPNSADSKIPAPYYPFRHLYG